VVTAVTPIEAFDVVCVELEHPVTGAKWLHIDSQDENNVFNVAFRTTPTDSTGVAHVLEHTALCGSERYPVRDPFFNMLKRSLSTFMNAMTGPDYTMYPFATGNRQDYNNLLGVYLDAAFFPHLSASDFAQEGHRLEFKTPDDPQSGLAIKGVVFNEMKGAMGSQGARFNRALTEALFPTSTYHHNFGGDPLCIPDLSHEQLQAFHAEHYHPSNACFYSYGSMPLEETLHQVQDLALSRFEYLDVSRLDVEDEERFASPKRLEVLVPADAMVADEAKQSLLAVAYLMVNHIKEPDTLDSFALSVASDLMLSGPQATFYKPLIEAGLGSGFAPGTGQSTRRESSFAVGLKGVAEEDLDKVESTILSTLESIAVEGFPRARVNATLHQVELGASTVSTQFGINAGLGVMATWVHGGDALRPLRVPALAKQLEAALDADEEFWQKLIRRRFLENPHRLTLVGRVDSEYDAKLEAQEAAMLQKRAVHLTADEVAGIIRDAATLKAAQEAPQAVECLPTLVVAESVPAVASTYLSAHSTVAGVPVQWDAAPTNGISYVSANFDLSQLPDRLAPYLELFTDFLNALGTTAKSPEQLAEAIKGSTGGISAGLSVVPSLTDTREVRVELALGAQALDRKVPEMFALLDEVTTGVRWAGEELRMGTLITRRAASAGASLSSQGLSYARSQAVAELTPSGWLEDRIEGLPHVHMVQRMAQDRDAAVEEVSTALAEIAEHVFGGSNTPSKVGRCRVACQEGSLGTAEEELEGWLRGLGSAPPVRSTWQDPAQDTLQAAMASCPLREGAKAFVAVPSQTNHCAAALLTVPYTHPDAASLHLLAQVMSTCYLHTEIREKGGAYGGGCSASPLGGMFSFSSFRDPRTLETLDTFQHAMEWAATEGNIRPSDVEEAHLRAFKVLDAPIPPSARGARVYASGIDDETRQVFRERLLACTIPTLHRVAEAHLMYRTPSVAIVGNAAAIPVTHGIDGWSVIHSDAK